MTPNFGDAGSIFGIGMVSPDLPSIEGDVGGGLIALGDAGNALFFSKLAGNNGIPYFLPEFYNLDGLVPDGANYKLTRTDGTVVEFYGFGTGIPAAQRGQLAYYADPGGNLTSTTYNASGQLTAISRSDATSSETYAYTYVGGGGPNRGLVSNVKLSRTPAGAGSAYVVQQVAFTYYGGTYSGADSYGNAGNLRSETLQDAAGNPIGTTYFRYYTPAEVAAGAIGYAGGLKYQFNPQSYARLVAAQGNPLTTSISDANASPYADQYYEYDQYQRVTKTTVQGAGCSCSGSTGQGTYTYAYTTNSPPRNPFAYNSWQTKTVETLPDLNRNIVYTNAAGEAMVRAFHDVADAGNSALAGLMWATYDRYDVSGRLVLEAQPSAVSIASPAALDSAAATYADIVGYDAGSNTYQSLRPGSGLINLTEYGTSTTATSGSPGDAIGFLKGHKVQNGYSGTAILLDATQYIANTVAGASFYSVAAMTVYRNTDGTGAETTSESYTWFSGTNQVKSVAESAPVVSSPQNGPGTADVTTVVYDIYGRIIWTKDADGFIGYTAYDAGTGAVVVSIDDVNTALTAEFAGLPSGWATPAGGGLNLVTTAQVDGQGRSTMAVSPNGNVTYRVYDDPDHEVRTYRGWNAAAGTTTGPTEVTRVDYPGNYTETLTMTATPATTGAAGFLVPTGAEAISGLQTLDRVLGDNTGREVEDDAYSSLSGLTYSASSRRLGTLGTNYYATYHGYDDMGRPARVVDAVGTITDTTYDSLGRVAATAVGTDDTYTPGPTGPSNMVTVYAEQYDGNGVGDGNLTRDTQDANSTAAPDTVTVYAYDWRDRLVATKSGDTMLAGPEDSLTNRPLLYRDLDNLDEVVAVSRYDADGVGISNAKPSSGLLRAYATTAFDDQGRVYRQQKYSVDPSTGAISANALTTSLYYDHRGDAIATYAPGGLVTKRQYDGAGRLASESATDGAAGPSWANAGSLAGDHVLTQALTTYDLDGNPTQVTTADRAHDATDTGSLIGSGLATTPAIVQVLDDSSPYGYSSTGGLATYSGGNDNTHQGVNNAPSALATWTFNVAPGTYTLAATWTLFSGCVPSISYTVKDGTTTLGSYAVSQQVAPVGFTDQGATWQQLGGSFTVTGTTLTVTLPGASGGWISADAIRIQQVVSARIIDDTSPVGYTTNGSGGALTTYTGGFDNTHQGANNAAGSSATWTFNVAPGTYSVAATWTSFSGSVPSISYTVKDGATTLGSYAVSQQVGPVGFSDQGSTWQQLGGTFTVTGTTLTVTLPGAAGGWISADAIRIQPVTYVQSNAVQVLPSAPIQVIDDSSPSGYGGTGGLAQYGGGFANTHQGVNNAPAALATWTFNVTPGVYSVAATWTLFSGCVPSISYTVKDGSTTLGSYAVSQRDAPSGFTDQGATWQQLGGTFTITGTTLTVTLPGASGGWISADAIRIQRVGARVSYATAYYDAADRPVAVVDLGTNGGVPYTRPVTPPARSDIALVTSVQYNAAGWTSLITDPRGLATSTAYDALGRPTRVIDGYNASINGGLPTNAANRTTTITYDGIDDVTTVTAVMPSGTAGQTTTYAYGVTAGSGGSTITSNDLLASITQPGTPTQTKTYTYDALGDVLAMTDPNGTTHSYTYDALGRRMADAVTTLGGGVDGAVRLLTTAYDSLGHPYLFTSYNATTGGTVVNQVQDSFNGLEQLTAEYQEHGGAVNVSTSPAVRYAYTEMSGGQNNSRPIGMTYPNGRVLDFLYNTGVDTAISRPGAIVDDATSTTLESYRYLGLGTIVEIDHPQPGVKLTSIRLPGATGVNADGGDQYTGLDRFGRVVDQDWVNSSGTQLVRYQYGYDRDGDALYRSDLVNTALSELYHANSTSSGDNATAYDGLGRLTGFARGTLSASGRNGTSPDTVASPSASQSWSLDALGNWSSVTTNGSTTTRTFNAKNQATAVAGGTAPTYDGDGNTLTNSGQSFVYDAWSRLVAVKTTATGVTVASYGYDALGDRINEAYAGSTDHLYYAPGGGVIEERVGGTASSNLAAQQVWGAAGNLVLRDAYSGGTLTQRLYPLRDANGDTTALVNTGGTVLERYAYSPYGAVTVLDAGGTPVSGNASAYGWRYLFQGGRLDTISGLYKFGARDYNPNQGTWLERDPLGLAAGDENLYRFVGNDPVDWTDPSGLAPPAPGGYIGGGLNPANWGRWALTGDPNAPDKYFDAALDGYGEGYHQAYNDQAPGAVAALNFASRAPGAAGYVAVGANLAYQTLLNPNDPDPENPSLAVLPPAGLGGSKGSSCPPKAPKAKINPQKQAGHIPGTPQNLNRAKQEKPTSTFHGERSGEMATQIANQRGTPVPGRPNVKEYDFGIGIGTGPNGGTQRSVRVHTSPKTGEIHGHPSGPEGF